MVDLIFAVVVVVAVVLFIVALVTGWFSRQRGATGFLTAYHDFSPRDKQKAVETVMETKAGKKMFAQKSGEDKDNEPKQTDD
jgi:hypothetical protein